MAQIWDYYYVIGYQCVHSHCQIIWSNGSYNYCVFTDFINPLFCVKLFSIKHSFPMYPAHFGGQIKSLSLLNASLLYWFVQLLFSLCLFSGIVCKTTFDQYKPAATAGLFFHSLWNHEFITNSERTHGHIFTSTLKAPIHTQAHGDSN